MDWLYQDPSQDAENTLNQIPGTITPYYQPYINAGNQALGALGTQYSNLIGNNYNNLQSALTQMLTNPASIVSQMGAGYQESPGYQWEMSQGLDAANNAAAAGGYLGTPQNEQFDTAMAEGIANQDYEQYLQNVMGVGKAGLKGVGSLYGAGLQGTQGLNQMGYNASDALASGLAQYLNELATLQYASTVNQNEHNMGLLGMGVSAVDSYLQGRNKKL